MCLAWIVTGLNRDWPESWLAWIVSGLSGVWPESCLFGLNRAYWAWIEMDLNRTGLNRDWPESCPAWVVGPESCQAWIVHFWPESRWAWIVTGLNRDRPESCLAWVVRPESFGLNRAGLNRRAWIKCESSVYLRVNSSMELMWKIHFPSSHLQYHSGNQFSTNMIPL